MEQSTRARPDVSSRIVWSHFLTRTGDQMWAFVVPLALVSAFGATILPQALYGFATQGAGLVLGPYFGVWMDRQPRMRVIQVGIALQALSVATSSVLLGLLIGTAPADAVLFQNTVPSVLYCLLLLSAMAEQLGTMVMDISVERDWVPVVVPEHDLSRINSLMRRIDLITEVCSPVVAGLVLWPSVVGGFVAVAVLNFVSFIPQYLLLRSVYHARPELARMETKEATSSGLPSPSQLLQSLRVFRQQDVALVIVAYACLWLTVLSPHGALLTAYIKESNFFPRQYSDVFLGLFRAVGALFGVVSTYLFRPVMRRSNLVWASAAFIWIEAGGVLLALIMFLLGAQATNILFLVSVLLSRVGLYGFCIGEVQLAQLGIPADQRGAVNSIESALTSGGTMLVYLMGAVLYQPENFRWLVLLSATAVTLGAALFTAWSRTQHSQRFWSVTDADEGVAAAGGAAAGADGDEHSETRAMLGGGGQGAFTLDEGDDEEDISIRPGPGLPVGGALASPARAGPPAGPGSAAPAVAPGAAGAGVGGAAGPAAAAPDALARLASALDHGDAGAASVASAPAGTSGASHASAAGDADADRTA